MKSGIEKPKIGLVVSGGGAKGAYSVGVVSALKQFGIEPHIVTGTSTGALIASMVVADDQKKLVDIWRKLTSNQIYSRMWKLSFILSFLGTYTYPYLSSLPLYQLIKRSVDIEKIQKSPKQLIINTFNLTLGKVFRFYNDFHDIHTALLASSSIPVLFPPVKMDNHLFVDGGVTDNVPLKSAILAGANKIYIVMNFRQEDLSNKKIRNNLAMALRIMDAAQYDNLLTDIEHVKQINTMVTPGGRFKVLEIITIQPSKSLELNPMEFNNSYKLNRAIDLGFNDAMNLLSKPSASPDQATSPEVQTNICPLPLYLPIKKW